MQIGMKPLKIAGIITLLGCPLAIILYYSGVNSINTSEVYFFASNPLDWEQEDKSILLHGRWYFPRNIQTVSDLAQKSEVPIVLMFHGVTRSLEDNDYFARQLAGMGIATFAIDFRGHGLSNDTFPVNDGSQYNLTFGDAFGAYRYLASSLDLNKERLLVHGTSLGGGASLFLALSGLIPRFLVWYPATAYLKGDTPLYMQNGTDSLFKGLILAGTADECTRCLPEYNEVFVANNPTVEIQWLEGATHTDSRFFLDCLDRSIAWVCNLFEITPPNMVVNAYNQGFIGIGVGVIVLLVDFIAIIIYLKQKRANAQH